MKTRSDLSSREYWLGTSLKGRSGGGVRAVGGDAHGRKGAHVEPEGGRAGAAVIQKAHRPGGGFGVVEGVGDVEDAAVGLVFLVADEEGAGGGGVLEGLAVEGERVMSGGRLFLPGWGWIPWRRLWAARGGGRLREGLCLLGLGGELSGGREEERSQQDGEAGREPMKGIS